MLSDTTDEDTAARVALAEARLGLRFQRKELLLQALVHRSYVLERERDTGEATAIVSNERLEFLGDAVLGLLVSHLLYSNFPDFDEGKLTEARSALVRRSTLAQLAEERGLGPLLSMGRAERRRSGKGYATVMAEAFEALLAAVYLDRGLDEALRFLDQALGGRMHTLVQGASHLNAKSRLQELAQEWLHETPYYTLVARSGPAHDSLFEVEVHAGAASARGAGTSIRAAEQQAAQHLLHQVRAAHGPESSPEVGKET